MLKSSVPTLVEEPARSQATGKPFAWLSKLVKKRRRISHLAGSDSDRGGRPLTKRVDKPTAKRSLRNVKRHLLSSGEDESCDEDVGWPSSYKYRKRSAVCKVVRGHIERQPLCSSDEDELLSKRFSKQKKLVVKRKLVARRVRSRLFYQDDSSSESDVEKGVERNTTNQKDKLDQQESVLPSISPKTDWRVRVDNYCIVSTLREGDVLKVYVSKHMPQNMYPHLLHWFRCTPDKNNLLGTIDLAEHQPEDVSSIIDFFSPQKPWCRSLYSHNNPHCQCCAPFMYWCARQVQDARTQSLIAHTMIPAVLPIGLTQAKYRRFLHFLKHPEQMPDPFPVTPKRNPNKFYHCR